MTEPPPPREGERFPRSMIIVGALLGVAALIIIFAGVKAAQSIVGPFCLAAFLAVILTAPLRWLKSKGFSDLGSSLIICAVVVFCGFSIIWILAGSVNQFLARIPEYTVKFNKTLTDIDDYLEPYGFSLQGGPKETKRRFVGPLTHLFTQEEDPATEEDPKKPIGGETLSLPKPESDEIVSEKEENETERKAAEKEEAPPFPFLNDPMTPEAQDAINTVGIAGYVRWGAAELGKLATTCFIVMILVVFMMFEASRLPKKLISAFGPNGMTNEHLQQVVDKIWKYILIKSMISFCVGFLVWVLLMFTGVEYALLWALIAFLLNFIPNIGSIIAAIPPIALALFDQGLGTCVIVTVGYLAINQGLGYYVEPIYLGDGLGISPLVVLLSLIFWGWILGLIGMFLSAPLTIVVKIILDSSDETRWASRLMDDK